MPIIEQEIQQNASKAAPTSNQQKRQHVAIVARVPDIISSVLFFEFVCLCQNTCPPTFSTKRTTCLPTDFQLCIENTKKSAQFSSFLQDAIAIHLLSNTILPGVLFFLLFNLTYATFHFEPLCHRKKIPSKSFVLYSHSNSILFTAIAKQEASAYFHISPSYCLFHSERRKNPFSNSN